MSSTLNKRKCGCGQFIATHDNGTLKRHTRQSTYLHEFATGKTTVTRVRCHYSGKFPPAIVRMRYDANQRIEREVCHVTGTEKGTPEFIKGLRSKKYIRTQILLSHKREGSRKSQKAYTRHVSGGQVKNRKRYAVAVATVVGLSTGPVSA